MQMARDSLLDIINSAIQSKASKDRPAQAPWDLAAMEWLNPFGLDSETVAKLSKPREPSESGLCVKRGTTGAVTSEWVHEGQTTACPSKQRLQFANRLTCWAGIPPKDLRPALKLSGLSDREVTTLWKQDLFPGIAQALHDIRTTATDEERAWEEDRARHPRHIHKDYKDRWWPVEETGKRVMQTARRKVRAWRLVESSKCKRSKKARADAAEEEAAHSERMRRPQWRAWVPQSSIPLLTDEELMEAMPNTMDRAMRRALQDHEDDEFKRTTKQQAKEEEKNRQTRAEEEQTRAKKGAQETSRKRNIEEVGANANSSEEDELQVVDNGAGWEVSDEATATARFEKVKQRMEARRSSGGNAGEEARKKQGQGQDERL